LGLSFSNHRTFAELALAVSPFELAQSSKFTAGFELVGLYVKYGAGRESCLKPYGLALPTELFPHIDPPGVKEKPITRMG
jgi:hypothetical protein